MHDSEARLARIAQEIRYIRWAIWAAWRGLAQRLPARRRGLRGQPVSGARGAHRGSL